METTTAPKTAASALQAIMAKAVQESVSSKFITLRTETDLFDKLNGKKLAQFLIENKFTSFKKASSVFTNKENNEETRTPIFIDTTPKGKFVIHMSKALREELAEGSLSVEELASCEFRKTWNIWEQDAQGKYVPKADAVEVLMLTKPGAGRTIEDEADIIGEE